ncbi:hypothetical protein D9M71_490280 [compost metagenome]
MHHVVRECCHAQAGHYQLGDGRHAAALVARAQARVLLVAPDHRRVVLHRVVWCDPRHAGGGLAQALAPLWLAADYIGGRTQVAANQVLRRCVGQAQGDVGVAPAEVGEGIGGAHLQRQSRVVGHELGQRRQQQAVHHRLGAGQPHRAADHLLATGHGDARRLQRLLGALGLFGQGLGGVGRQVALAALDEQGGAQRRLQPTDRTEYGRNVDFEQLGGFGQRAATFQCQDQGEVGVGNLILHWCTLCLPNCQCLLHRGHFIVKRPPGINAPGRVTNPHDGKVKRTTAATIVAREAPAVSPHRRSKS